MIIVSNTTPLIGLATIGQFELLHQLFGEIYIPKAVYDEAVTAGREEGGAKQEVTEASWVMTVEIQDRLAVDVLLDELDLGEAEAIVLARELNANWVLMDEKKGRRKLTQLEIQKIGTIGILLKAKEMKLIQSIRQDLEQLREKGFSISQAVIDAVLEQAQEK
jgi:uncharacterized protein